jgi:hypothetical protein
MNSEITYEDKVGGALLALQLDEVLTLEEKVAPANRDNFIAVVKSYIDRDFGKREGWEIIFSNNFCQVKKICYLCVTTQLETIQYLMSND